MFWASREIKKVGQGRRGDFSSLLKVKDDVPMVVICPRVLQSLEYMGF